MRIRPSGIGSRLAAVVTLGALLALAPASADAGWGHRSRHGHYPRYHGYGWSHGHVGVPWLWFGYAYHDPWCAHPGYGSVWPDEPETESERPRAGAMPSAEEARRTSYGLVQLRGVPDGASVELDGRHWLTARLLDDRWLGLPRGLHTLRVLVDGARPFERGVDVVPGVRHVVDFDRPPG